MVTVVSMDVVDHHGLFPFDLKKKKLDNAQKEALRPTGSAPTSNPRILTLS